MMNRGFFKATVCALLALTGGWTLFAAETARKPKALVIMLDGCRADVFGSWATSTFRQLRAGEWQPGYRCAWSLNASTIYDAVPSSAPNHVAIATGVTAAKHGCTGNDQASITAAHWDTYPCWLKRVVTADPSRKALYVYKWGADCGFGGGTDGVPQYNSGTEAGNLAKVLEELNSSNGADAILYYIDDPDHTGHSTGFYPLNDTYFSNLQTCDNSIAQCLAAIEARPTFKNEDWYIAITADHGGIEKTHGVWGGHCESVPVCITSRNVPHGRIAGAPYHMITTVTALEHFGIDTSSLSLDQAPLTAAMVADPAGRDLADGLQFYLPFDDASTVANALDNGKTVSFAEGMGTSTLGADGKFGKSFTAQNRGVTLSGTKNHDFENGTDFCATMWVKVPSSYSSDPCIFGDKNWNKGANNGFALVANSQKGGAAENGIFFNYKIGSTRMDIGSMRWTPGSWEFYAVVRDGANGLVSLYRGRADGTLEWVSRKDTAFVWGGYDFHVGQDGTGTYGASLNGTGIDDVGFWGRALNVEEIRRIFAAGQMGRSLGELMANDTEPRTLAVSSFSNNSVELVLGGDSSRTHKLFVASGASDGGNDKQAWTDFTEVADIPVGATSYTFTPPAAWNEATGATTYRFFLLQTTDLPYAQELEYVQSDGNAYVVTDFAPYNPYVRMAADLLAPKQNGTWMWMLGSYSTANTKTPKLGNFSLGRRDTGKFYWEISGANSEGRALALNTKYAMSFSPTTLTVDGVDYATGQTRAGFQTGTYKLSLFRTCKNGAYGTSYDSPYNGRFYNFRGYDHERLVQDFVPVKTSDNKIGYYDTVYGKFYGNSGSGSLTGGTLDATKEAARRGIVRAQSVTLTYQPATVPVIAVWTGAGTDPTVYAAADNWSCTNSLGLHLPNAIPTADTEQIVLDADADWRALAAGTEFVAPVDLRGHALTLAAAVTGTVRDASEATGTVRFDVAEGATLSNANLKLDGNLKFVKAGAGTLVQQAKSNTYSGGTEVLAGKLTTPVSGSGNVTWSPMNTQVFGVEGNAITVRAGAVFDTAGNYHYHYYPFVLDGGTLRNSGCEMSQTTWMSFNRITLTADSVLDCVNSTLQSQNPVVDLGGHTLDVHIADGRYWFVAASTFTNGTVKVSLDGTQATSGRVQLMGDVESSTANWDCNCCLEFKNNLTARDFTCRRDGAWGWSEMAKKVFVKGTFTPVSDYFCNVEMLDGSTLDLTGKAGVWSATSLDLGNSRTFKTTFANDATVTVKLAGRTLTATDQVIAWTDQPASTTFAWDAATAEAGIAPVAATVGLFYGTDPESRVVNTAVWTGGAGNGNLADMGNWECRNLAGNVVTEAVPGEVAKVTIAGENLNVQIPVGSPLAYAKLVIGECTLGANCDWRGLAQNLDGNVNLNGHQLQLSHVRGNGRVFNNLLVNGGFENCTAAVSNWSRFSETMQPLGWSPKTEGLGVSTANNTWATNAGDKPLPQGTWCLFLQADDRVIEQTFTVKEAGEYTFIFYAAGRPNHLGLAVNAQIDGTTVATAPCDSIAWTRYTVPLTLTAGEHKVGFLSAATSDGDVCAAIDSVILSRNGESGVVVDVPENKVEVNSPMLALDGNFQLVKEGAGILTVTYGPQSYMGTEIRAGTLRSGTTMNNGQLGVRRDCEVGVAAEATLDLWGRNLTHWIIRLDGGKLRNSYAGASVGDWDVVVDWVRLTADSEFTFDNMAKSHDLKVDTWGVWDLGGHTFTVFMQGSDPDFYVYEGTTFKNGTLKIVDDGVTRTFFQNNGLVGTDNFTLDHMCELRLHKNSTISNFINRTWNGIVGSDANCLLTITGTYTPLSSYGVNTRMANGSTVDLSSRTTVWNTTTTNTGGALSCTTTFADNARITIDLHGRVLRDGQQVVAWTKPANYDTLTFVPDAQSRAGGIRLVKKDDGIYVVCGLLIIIR